MLGKVADKSEGYKVEVGERSGAGEGIGDRGVSYEYRYMVN